jgi:carboxyl-terminal processing protease
MKRRCRTRIATLPATARTWVCLTGVLVVWLTCTAPLSPAQSPVPAPPAAEKRSDQDAADGHTGGKTGNAERAGGEGNAETEQARQREYLELLKLFVDTLDQIDRNYVKDVDRRRLVEGAVRGMLSELDPYSQYIAPEQIDRFRRGVESEFGGVGIQVRIEGDELQIVSPIYGTPAYESGLMAGDVIVEIAGQSALGITLDEAVKLMKGKIGTNVSLKIKSPGADKPRNVSLRREVIRVRTVLGERRREDDSWDYMLDAKDRIGLIRLSSFGRHTAEELQAALEQLEQQGMRGLILDLRSNPGGLLSTAVEVCDLFVPEGRIVSTSGRNSPSRSWEARRPGTVGDFPMAVLVNRFSASASEIVSACLQDHQRAVVIGERTWGKGSVQNIIELEQGKSAVKLTTATYLRPSGANIHRHEGDGEDAQWGVQPNPGFEVKLSVEEARQLEAARRERDLIRRRPSAPDQEKTNENQKAEEVKEREEEKQEREEKESKQVPSDASEQPGTSDGVVNDSPGNQASPPVDHQLQKALDFLREKLGTSS